jgi:FkbM family methyltransferase
MRAQIRKMARRVLPEAIRKPLGFAAGQFDAAVIQRIQGLFFDWTGRKFKLGDCSFAIPKDQTSLAYRASFFSATYEAEDLEVVRACIRPDDRVLELGACMGVVSCVTNKMLTDKTAHVVVEANPFCLPVLHRNRELNQCGFLVEHCAVSGLRDVTFHVNPKVIVSSSLQVKTNTPVRVPARSLVELDARYGPFTALIADIEGAELETFESARDVLRRYRLVIVELHDWALGEAGLKRCREILSESGLQCAQRIKWVEAWQRIEN